jgi:hypothetical protein
LDAKSTPQGVIIASEFTSGRKRPIQDRNADCGFGLLGGEAACSQPRSDQGLGKRCGRALVHKEIRGRLPLFGSWLI